VSNRACGGEGTLEVTTPVRHITAKTQTERLRRLENDQRVDGAARTRAHRRAERAFGLGMLAEMREGASFGAEEGGAEHSILSSRQFAIAVICDADDSIPVLKSFEIGTSRSLVGEVVPGASWKVIRYDLGLTLVQ
jgi:hypothetical protein